MQGKKNLRSKICSAALKFPIAACPQALCASLSRSAPSVTAAKPLRLRAPFSGPPGRKAVHSASCLSRLLPGAPRFSLVTLRSGQVARSLLRASLLSRCAGRPPPNERQPSARPVAYGCRELRGRPPSAFHIKRRPLLRASLLSRSACSRRAASLRLKQNPVPLRGPWAFALAPVHPRCSRRLRASLLSRSACSRRAASLRLKQNPVPLRGPRAFAFAALHPRCSRRLRASHL